MCFSDKLLTLHSSSLLEVLPTLPTLPSRSPKCFLCSSAGESSRCRPAPLQPTINTECQYYLAHSSGSFSRPGSLLAPLTSFISQYCGVEVHSLYERCLSKSCAGAHRT